MKLIQIGFQKRYRETLPSAKRDREKRERKKKDSERNYIEGEQVQSDTVEAVKRKRIETEKDT